MIDHEITVQASDVRKNNGKKTSHEEWLMNSFYHAKSAAKKWGGSPYQYIEIESFIDSSKSVIGDVRHRSMYHHTTGIFLCEKIFGRTIQVGGRYAVPQQLNYFSDEMELTTTSPSLEIIDYGPIREIPVRLIAELHVMQDLGWIPSPKDYIDNMELKQWMGGSVRSERSLTEIFPKQVYLDKPIRRESEEETSYLEANFNKFFRKLDPDLLNRETDD